MQPSKSLHNQVVKIVVPYWTCLHYSTESCAVTGHVSSTGALAAPEHVYTTEFCAAPRYVYFTGT
jgi:hypothetical protein